MKIGQKVWTGVFIGSEWQRMASGIIVAVHDGYYDVDIMSLHGGAAWITQHTYIEPFE